MRKAGVGEIKVITERRWIGGRICSIEWKPADTDGRELWIHVPPSRYWQFSRAENVEQAYTAVRGGSQA